VCFIIERFDQELKFISKNKNPKLVVGEFLFFSNFILETYKTLPYRMASEIWFIS
jgi:hypothetical protein